MFHKVLIGYSCSIMPTIYYPTVLKPWHKPSHHQKRTEVALKIKDLLACRRSAGSREWRTTLPILAKKLETALYFEAANEEEHFDLATLKPRLRKLGIELKKFKETSKRDPRLSVEAA